MTRVVEFRDGFRDDRRMQLAPHAPAVRTNTVRIGYARVDESVTSIAAHLKIGRSTLYRALAETEATATASG